jgi:hypothetical protein
MHNYAAGLSLGVGILRIGFPESQQFLIARAAGKKSASTQAFLNEFKQMMRAEWKMCIYCIILMTWVSIIASLHAHDNSTRF